MNDIIKIAKEVGAMNESEVFRRLRELEIAHSTLRLTFLDQIELNFLSIQVLHLNKNNHV